MTDEDPTRLRSELVMLRTRHTKLLLGLLDRGVVIPNDMTAEDAALYCIDLARAGSVRSTYPREEGDIFVLGPSVIATTAEPGPGTVLNWRGVNFIPERGDRWSQP